MKKLLTTTVAALLAASVYSQPNALPANGDVGIGTTSPLDKLDVNGIIRVSGTNRNWRIMSHTQDGNLYFRDESSGQYMPLTLGVNNRVGINNTNPQATLDVHGSTIINSKLSTGLGSLPAYQFETWDSGIASGRIAGFYLPNMSTIGEMALLHIGGNRNHYGVEFGAAVGQSTPNVQNHAFVIRTNPGEGTGHIERFRVTASGYVGIGTSNPSAKLHLNDGVFRTNYTGTDLFNTSEVNLTSSSSVGMGTMHSVYTNTNATADFMGKHGYKFEGGINTSSKQFQVYLADNSIPKFVISGNGNVGLGTSTPASKLDVSGSIQISDPIGSVGIKTLSGTSFARFVNADVANNVNQSGISLNGYVNTSNNNLMQDNSSLPTWMAIFSAERDDFRIKRAIGGSGDASNLTTLFRISNNGNVAIGTSNAQSYKLAVNGTIHTKEVKVDLDGWSDFVFDPSYKLRGLKETEQFIKENRHLPGIPSAAEVANDGVKLGEMINQVLASHTVEHNLWASYSTAYHINTLNPSGVLTDRFTIDPNGNVGIGTTSPFSRLHVKEGAHTGTLALGSDTYPGLISSSAVTGELRFDNRSSFIGYISFFPNGQGSTVGAEAMRIDKNGNVGIGC
jgi:hypothetical protein